MHEAVELLLLSHATRQEPAAGKYDRVLEISTMRLRTHLDDPYLLTSAAGARLRPVTSLFLYPVQFPIGVVFCIDLQ